MKWPQNRTDIVAEAYLVKKVEKNIGKGKKDLETEVNLERKALKWLGGSHTKRS